MTAKHKRTLARIVLAGALLIAAYFVPAEGLWRLAAYAVPYFVIGWDVLWRSAENVAHGEIFDENFLMSVATIGAMATGEYAEGVAVMLFYQVGELCQSIAVGKSRRSIAALMDIRPEYANVLRDGQIMETDPEEVAVGETIVIKPGERIPLDCVVLEGAGSVNTAAMTGESAPRDVEPGDRLISGTVNINSVLKARVESVYAQSTVARVLDMVENSAERKAKTENFITKFARYYTPAVVFSAVALALIPPLAFDGAWGVWVHRALAFLVVSCPCALVISVPLTFFAGLGGASKQGILVKGSNYLEALSHVDAVVFDKTGTLTQGAFRVTEIRPVGMEAEELLRLTAAAESFSTHPIARAIVERAGDRETGDAQVEELAGRGVRASVDGHTVLAGNRRLMAENGIDLQEAETPGTAVYVSVDGAYAGDIVIRDTVKEDAKLCVDGLHAQGVRVAMLTGDRRPAAEAVARELGIDETRSELMPEDKVSGLETIMETARGAVAFVGDGINDAPVLMRADVGLAMGALGSDAAIEAADMVLMDDKPSRVPQAIRVARRTMRIVWQNILFALAVKLGMLLLIAVGYANMWLAVFADVGVALLAILNALRAMKTSGAA